MGDVDDRCVDLGDRPVLTVNGYADGQFDLVLAIVVVPHPRRR
jgi:hypothetical protein